MSLMTCSRKGCDRILCCHYSPRFGHLCPDCFRELKEYCVANNGFSSKIIIEFMNSKKMSNASDKLTEFVEDYLGEEFRPPE